MKTTGAFHKLLVGLMITGASVATGTGAGMAQTDASHNNHSVGTPTTGIVALHEMLLIQCRIDTLCQEIENLRVQEYDQTDNIFAQIDSIKHSDTSSKKKKQMIKNLGRRCDSIANDTQRRIDAYSHVIDSLSAEYMARRTAITR